MRTKRFTFNISDAEKAYVDRECRRKGMSMSELIRSRIEDSPEYQAWLRVEEARPVADRSEYIEDDFPPLPGETIKQYDMRLAAHNHDLYEAELAVERK